MDPLVLVIAGVIATAIFAFVVGLRDTRARADDVMAHRLGSMRKEGVRQAVSKEQRGPLLKQRVYSGMPLFSAFLQQFRASERVAVNLERAGLPLRVGEYYMIRLGLAAVCFLLPFAFSRTPFTFLMALGLGFVGWVIPSVWVSGRKRGRTIKVNAQLTEMLGLIANSLKSGYGLMQSFEFASKQIQPPLGTELKQMLRDANLGMAAEEALGALGERIASADLDMVLTAINIQRAVGGNLAEVLEQVAFTMRERERIRGEIQTLTAQQRMTGIVIGGLPVGLGLLFMVINPGYMTLLFTETAGKIMLVVAVALEVLGAVSIRKILAIDV